jgi:arsenate reductase (thioredoxin)
MSTVSPNGPTRVLILCTGNSARSQMAEGWLRRLGGERFAAFSAGTHPARRVNPLAVRVMAEVGVDITEQFPKHLEHYLRDPFDYVITVCDSANEECPHFPGAVKRIHHSFQDPSLAPGSDEERLEAFRRSRDEIGDYIRDLVAERPG